MALDGRQVPCGERLHLGVGAGLRFLLEGRHRRLVILNLALDICRSNARPRSFCSASYEAWCVASMLVEGEICLRCASCSSS